MSFYLQEVGLRLLAILLIIIAILIDVKHVHPLINIHYIQIIIAALLILVIIADPIAGLISALALMTLYIRITDNYAPKAHIVRREGDFNIIKTPFVTADNLKSAQNNVVSTEKELDNGIKGIKGVYGEAVYGAQGLDKEMPGYSPAF